MSPGAWGDPEPQHGHRSPGETEWPGRCPLSCLVTQSDQHRGQRPPATSTATSTHRHGHRLGHCGHHCTYGRHHCTYGCHHRTQRHLLPGSTRRRQLPRSPRPGTRQAAEGGARRLQGPRAAMALGCVPGRPCSPPALGITRLAGKKQPEVRRGTEPEDGGDWVRALLLPSLLPQFPHQENTTENTGSSQ